jgi:type II secretory pathway component PulC
MGRERKKDFRGEVVSTSMSLTMPRDFSRQSVLQTGAAAMLLGAALLASSGAHAADVERDDNMASPAAPASGASQAPPAPAAPPAPPAAAQQGAEAAEQREAARQKRDEKLRDAQERLNQAASEVAALAAERAADAVEGFHAWADSSRRSVIGVQLSSDYRGEGAKVEDVSPGGPAESAGVRAGDLIVRVNGQDIKGGGSRLVARLLREVKPESKVRLRVERDGKERDIEVVARAFSQEVFVYRNDPPPGGPDTGKPGPFNFNFQFGPRSELRGLEVTTLTPQLGRYFGTNKGVLVVRAPSDDTLKLQDGDVILAIDGREPTSSSQIARILSSYQSGERLTLRVMRDQKTQDIVVTLPERAPTRDRTRTSFVTGTRM